VEEVVFLFAWRANAAYRAADQHCHSNGDEDRGQILTPARQVIQDVMHSEKPHTITPIIKKPESFLKFSASFRNSGGFIIAPNSRDREVNLFIDLPSGYFSNAIKVVFSSLPKRE
jgi:hypothetical protein